MILLCRIHALHWGRGSETLDSTEIIIFDHPWYRLWKFQELHKHMKRFCFKELRMSLPVLGPYYAHDSTFKIIFSIYGNKYMSMSFLWDIYFRQHAFCLQLMTTESFDVDKNAMSQHWLSFGIFVLIRIISATMALWQLKYIVRPYTNLNSWWHSR